MTTAQLTTLDAECNALFRKLDAMKANGTDKTENAEYMRILYELRDKTRERIAS